MAKTIGYIIFVISCISFLMILIVPLFGLSKVHLAEITTALIIVGEVFFYLSLFILGKSFYNKIKSKLIFWKKKTTSPDQSDQNDLKDVI